MPLAPGIHALCRGCSSWSGGCGWSQIISTRVKTTREKLTLGGRSAYSLYFEGGMGYRNDDTSGVAVGDEPETIYMVASGRRAASDERRP